MINMAALKVGKPGRRPGFHLTDEQRKQRSEQIKAICQAKINTYFAARAQHE